MRPRNWLVPAALLLTGAMVTLIPAGCGEGGGGTDGCTAASCPEGCCLDDKCLEPADNACGTGGQACIDCGADSRADACEAGGCICAVAGSRCPPGESCSADGCHEESCVPDCTGKCDGADDGCGDNCPASDCAPGCCDSANLCIAPGDQDDTRCGGGGGGCSDCTVMVEADSCVGGVCVCAAEGVACSPGQVCTASGCPCVPDCAQRCAGAGDGCGGSCPATDCDMGCCLPDLSCLGYSGLDDAACGRVGETCIDCAAGGQVCANFTCVNDIPNDAVFVDQTVPTSMQAGAQVNVSVSMRNAGTNSWSRSTDHKLGSQNPQDNTTWGFNRVPLEPADLILPGEAKTFSFQVTAPSGPGVYDFQWRMLQEAVEWFGEFGPTVQVAVEGGNATVCEAARPLAGTQTDAAGVIQGCIDAAPTNAIVEIPAGIYRVDHPVLIQSHPVTLRTEGTHSAQGCCGLDNHGCAELRASTAFTESLGILQIFSNGSAVDHLVIHGNKAARWSTPSGQQCSNYSNSYGYNVRMACNDCSFTNSVTRDALCGTGCEVAGVRSGITLWRNRVAYNGVHDQEGLWADGVTVHDAVDSSFTENEFVDSTDIDLIFGGCQNCVIQDNFIWHTDAFSGGSFAALMIHAWPSTSGDFTGSVTTGNTVDCGSQRRCGIGLYLGSDAWYITDVFGGEVHHNDIQNAEFGVLLDDVHDMAVYDNPVTNPATWSDTSCGLKFTHAYGIGDRSYNVDTSQDTLGTSYVDVDFDGCIPNWWNP